MQKLSDSELRDALSGLPEWRIVDGKLHREYKFGGFAAAFGFMSTCALVAQKQDHHPEWFNVFDRVVVDLTTHDAGGVSALDFTLAAEMEKAAGQRLEVPEGHRDSKALRSAQRPRIHAAYGGRACLTP